MRMGLLVTVTAIVLLSAVAIAVVPDPDEDKMTYAAAFSGGSMFISDAGTAIGGFEFTAGYTVLLIDLMQRDSIANGDMVRLQFSLEIGLGDPLSTHQLDGRITYDKVAGSVTIEGGDILITMIYEDEDTIWGNEYDGYYIASWGGYAPAEEIRGTIDPGMFGLPSHYYIELRLKLVWSPVLL